MGISIDQLQFDPTDPTSNQRVGSFIVGKSELVVTSTTIASIEALDVNLAGSSIVDLDIRDLTHVSDSVKIGDGTDFLAINTDGSINITDNSGSLTVDAIDLDIRDLVFANDKVDVSGSTNIGLDAATLAALESITVQNGAGAAAVNIQDGGNSITVDGTVELGATTLAALENITVSATDFDIRDLSHSQDSIKIGDGTDFLAINADGSINVNADISIVNGHEKLEDAAHASSDVGSYVLGVRSDIPAAATSASGDYSSLLVDNKGRLWVNDAANAAQSYGAVSVTTTAAEFLGSPLAGRKLLLLQNLGAQDVYIGFNGSVTSSNGIVLYKNSSIELPFGDNLDVFMVTSTGTADVRWMQLA